MLKGDNYKSAQSARDCDIIRPSVLKSLGWNIYKLWSTDWWENSNKILTEILDTINKLMKPTNNSDVTSNVLINKEAPINKTLLSRRIINAWGISRIGVRLNEYLDKQYEQLNLKYSIQDDNVFYWREDHILSQQISLPYDDLIREASRFFGYARLGSKVENSIKLGLKFAVKEGLIVEIDKRYVLN